ncbi:MAG: hypothetical protein IT531_10820 [Burkholderiales bacterium]|nr:hypothetical protein [Burkholderiales bacterium]
MFRLNEDLAKAWLRRCGCPVPRGGVAASAVEAARLARELGTAVVVKALIPAGRRGKAGAVRIARDETEAAQVADGLLGTQVLGHAVRRVLVEEKIAIAAELYLAYALDGRGIEMLASSQGGVDIEAQADARPGTIVTAAVDPLHGVTLELACEQWRRAGIADERLSALSRLSAQLYGAFSQGDATLLELNPIAIGPAGMLSVAGAMLAVDENALFRHPEWTQAEDDTQLPANPRERRVALVNRDVPGGECRYIELDGDIGLIVGGGGPGLYQHDLMLALGGRPANHCVTPPTGSDNRKLKAVIEAVLEHPRIEGLLVGFNFAQMARTDIRVRTLLEVIDEKRIDTAAFPIVIRLFGAGEEQSRAMAAGRPNIHYVPRGTTLERAVQLIIELVAARKRQAGA